MISRNAIALKKGPINLPVLMALFLLSAVSIGINGYFYGEFEHGLTLVFQKYIIDNNFYKNDAVLGVKDYYYTYLYELLAVPSKAFGIQNTYFFLYFLSTYLFYIAVFLLADALFKKSAVSFMSVILALVNKNLIASDVIFPVFFPRVAAFPFLLIAILFFINRRYALSFSLIGLMMNIHITTASHVFLLLMLCLLLDLKNIGFKRIFGYGALAFTFSLPTFIWTRMYPAISLSPPQQWWDIIHTVFPHHLAPFSWGIFRWIQAFAFVLLFFLSLRYRPKGEKHAKVMRMVYAMAFLAGLWTFFYYVLPLSISISSSVWVATKFIAVLFVVYISNYIFNLYKGGYFHKIASAGLAASVFVSNFKAMLLFALLIIALDLRRKHPRISLALLISFSLLLLLSAIGSITPYVPFVYSLKMGFVPLIIILLSVSLAAAHVYLGKFFRKDFQKKALMVAFISVVIFATLAGVLLLRKPLANPRAAVYEQLMESYEYDLKRLPPPIKFSEILRRPYNVNQKEMVRPITAGTIRDFVINPSMYFVHNIDFPEKYELNDWRKVQLWARDNTNITTLFITPPYMPDFRSYSERSTVGEWNDLAVANHNAEIGIRILDRVRSVCGSRITGICVENRCIDLCRDNYNKFQEREFQRIGKEYDAHYVVVEKPKRLNLRLEYENDRFRIYGLG